jgi:hypothetical protein
MNFKPATDRPSPEALESFVAELTEAAYPVALRHGVRRGSWVDLELELWRALEQAVNEWKRGRIS